MDRARVWFVHATMNGPREVGMVLGKRLPRPAVGEEGQHNSGITRRGIQGFLSQQRAGDRSAFDRMTELQSLAFAQRWSAPT
jgi:hypothetical protein